MHVAGDEFFTTYQPTVTSITAEGPTRLRLRYLRKLPPDKKKDGPDITGELILDPSRFHCVLEESHARGAVRFGMKRDIDQKDGEMIVTKMVFTDQHREETVTFQDYRFNAPVPEHECYMTHYGLPEPVDVTPPAKPRQWWPYIFGALAASCLIGALYCWRRTAPARQVQVSPPVPITSPPPS